MKEIHNKYTINKREVKEYHTGTKSMTVPDLTFSIRELMDKFTVEPNIIKPWSGEENPSFDSYDHINDKDTDLADITAAKIELETKVELRNQEFAKKVELKRKLQKEKMAAFQEWSKNEERLRKANTTSEVSEATTKQNE